MVCETFSYIDSPVHRLDPRLRVVAAAAFTVVVAVSRCASVVQAALALAVLTAALARLPAWPALKRLAAVNVFVVLIVATLPLAIAGETVLAIGPLAWSRPGLLRAGLIAGKVNAIVLMFTALLSTVEPATLGQALGCLRVPAKLIHLYLFTVRYADVLHHEYHRLREAMKVRAFRPRACWHTYRTYGHLIGMLLVRSFDRSERILQAMKCRAFRGSLHLIGQFSLARRDAVFAAASALGLLVLLGLEWLWRMS